MLNMESRGFTVAVFNRTVEKVDEFVNTGRGKGKKFVPAHSLEQLCKSLKKPRKVMMMVRAGEPVDQMISALLPFLEKGDIIIDGGNSHFPGNTEFLETALQQYTILIYSFTALQTALVVCDILLNVACTLLVLV